MSSPHPPHASRTHPPYQASPFDSEKESANASPTPAPENNADELQPDAPPDGLLSGSRLHLLCQALHWAAHAASLVAPPQLRPYARVLSAVDFTLRHGLPALAIPVNLVGSRTHSRALKDLLDSQSYVNKGIEDAGPAVELRLVRRRGRIAVVGVLDIENGRPSTERTIGFIPDRHRRWLNPLVGHGVSVRLASVHPAARGRSRIVVALCLPEPEQPLRITSQSGTGNGSQDDPRMAQDSQDAVPHSESHNPPDGRPSYADDGLPF